MSLQRIKVEIRHTFELDIPDHLLDEDGDDWALDAFIYDAFEEEDWEFSNLTINEIKDNN